MPIEAGQNGKQHLQQKLAEAVTSPCRLPVATAFFQANLLSAGYSFVAVEVTHTRDLNNFEAWCGDGGEDAKHLLSEWIWDFVSISPAHVCLIDETRSKASDPSWQADMLPLFAGTVRFSENAIFYHLSSSTISQEGVSEIVQSTFWFPFWCAFVVDDGRVLATPSPIQEIPAEQLLKVIPHSQGLVTDAYDLEGLLLWTKQQAFGLDKPF